MENFLELKHIATQRTKSRAMLSGVDKTETLYGLPFVLKNQLEGLVRYAGMSFPYDIAGVVLSYSKLAVFLSAPPPGC